MDIKNTLTQTGYLRLPDVLRLIPVSKTTWWDGITTGRFPKGVKIGSRITAWRVEDIQNLMNRLTNGEGNHV